MSAHARLRPEPPPACATLPDGSLVVTTDQLSAFGGGDPRRGRRELRLILASSRDAPRARGPPAHAKPASVTLGGPADEPALRELCWRDAEEHAKDFAPWDEGRVLAHIQVCTRRQGGICGVIREGDKIVAATLLVPTQWWWSQQWYYQDIMTYVHPDHRRSRHVDDLIAFQKWVADEHTRGFGYRVFLVSAIMSSRRVWEKIALWKRKFRQSGVFCIYPFPGEGR